MSKLSLDRFASIVAFTTRHHLGPLKLALPGPAFAVSAEG